MPEHLHLFWTSHILFCRLAQIIPPFKVIVKVTKSYVCTFGLIMEFGTALLLDRTQILQNGHIYII